MQHNISAILIDDEMHCLKTLRYELERYCPEVQVLATYNDAEQGLQEVIAQRPNLLFLDVEMPRLNGLQLLEKVRAELGEEAPLVVFTTAYDSFAVNAFRADALDYLMKPIVGEDLKRVMKKVNDRLGEDYPEQVKSLLALIKSSFARGNNRIALPTGEGIEYVPVENIIYCQSQGSYTRIVRDGKPELLISRNLKYVSDMLPEDLFLRVHNSYLVAANRIAKFIRQDGGYLVMDNGDSVGVSRSRRELFTK